MEDISKYIGIPYKFAGYSNDGCDCVGLLRWFYADHQWQEMYDGEFTKDWYKKEPHRMIRWFFKNMDKLSSIDKLKFGDICYFHINGEGHCGIYLEYGKMLSTFPPNCKQWDGTVMPSESFIVHRQMWEKGFKAGFRRR